MTPPLRIALAATLVTCLLAPAAWRTAAAQSPAPATKPAAKKKATPKTVAKSPDAGAPVKTATTPPADASPMAEMKKSNAALKKVLQKRSSPQWSPEAEAKNAEVRKIIGGFLDFEELSRRALAKHWDKLVVKQRQDFVSTLRQLVERSYVKQVHGQPDYDIKWENETRTGNEAAVTATLNTVAKKKKVAVALEYKMLWKDASWVVYDVVTDEQSLLENYRAEFNRIINKEGFDKLLERMKKKLEEKDPKTP